MFTAGLSKQVDVDPASASLAGILEAISRKLEDLPMQVAAAMPHAVRAYDQAEESRQQKESHMRQHEEEVSKIYAAKTMRALGELEGWHWNAMDNVLVCNGCAQYADDSHLPNASGCGCIQGVDLAKGDNGRERRPFYAVHRKMAEHVCGTVHEWCTAHAAKMRQRDIEQTNAGINVAKLVLQNIKEHDSDASFERRISAAKCMGSDVGTKNHSRAFVPKLRGSMLAILVASFMTLLTTPEAATGRPPPLAVLADKATVRRKTGQMHAIILMIEGTFVALFLSVLLAPDSTGHGLAAMLIDVLMNSKPLDLEANLIRISLTCTAYDGQYQSAHEGHSSGLQVTNHLCKQLDLNPKWVTSRWDGAHCIELGMDTVRKAINFYQLLASIVAGTHQRFLYGKNYDGICRAWSNFKDGVSNKSLGLQPAAIGSVCTSRFAHSERKVYKAYYRNLVIFLIVHRAAIARTSQ